MEPRYGIGTVPNGNDQLLGRPSSYQSHSADIGYLVRENLNSLKYVGNTLQLFYHQLEDRATASMGDGFAEDRIPAVPYLTT